MKVTFLLLVALALIGCAVDPGSGSSQRQSSPPSVKWVATRQTDKFTDRASCAVTVGALYTQTIVFTMSNQYYPYIEVVNGDLRVGVKSGGRVQIPVGDVQMRIDQNPAWTISTGETPLDYVPQGALQGMQAYTKNDPQQQLVLENSYKAAMQGTARAMSPFTAATGEKARAILKELRAGRTLIYRTVGLNQAASSTGEYALDQSLEQALHKCGIQ